MILRSLLTSLPHLLFFLHLYNGLSNTLLGSGDEMLGFEFCFQWGKQRVEPSLQSTSHKIMLDNNLNIKSYNIIKGI